MSGTMHRLRDHRSVGDGIGERKSDLDDGSPGLLERWQGEARRLERGKTAGDEGHQGRAARGEDGGDAGQGD
jgi:hypothetical protein